MNRRDFLRNLGATALAPVVAPLVVAASSFGLAPLKTEGTLLAYDTVSTVWNVVPAPYCRSFYAMWVEVADDEWKLLVDA